MVYRVANGRTKQTEQEILTLRWSRTAQVVHELSGNSVIPDTAAVVVKASPQGSSYRLGGMCSRDILFPSTLWFVTHLFIFLFFILRHTYFTKTIMLPWVMINPDYLLGYLRLLTTISRFIQDNLRPYNSNPMSFMGYSRLCADNPG